MISVALSHGLGVSTSENKLNNNSALVESGRPAALLQTNSCKSNYSKRMSQHILQQAAFNLRTDCEVKTPRQLLLQIGAEDGLTGWMITAHIKEEPQ